jgi:sugar phosphate isomerase/epimerase
VEILIFEDTPDYYTRRGEQLAKFGFDVTTVSVLGAGQNCLADDKTERKAAVERAKWVVECTKALRAVKYDGRLTIEAFGHGIPALAAATRVWRDVFPNNEEVYRFGFKHLKRGGANAGR